MTVCPQSIYISRSQQYGDVWVFVFTERGVMEALSHWSPQGSPLSAGLSDETHQAVGSFVSRWRSQTFTGFKALVSCLKTAVQAFYGHWWEPCLVTTPYICYISRLLKPYDRFVHEFCFRRLILGAVSVRLKLTIYFWCMEKSNVNTVQNIFFCAPQNCFFTTWVNYESFHFYVNS